ncbi:hypothetical protein F2Q68_00021150 [Brassica cretica]|uniref:Uncharacterized protein n=1 Tax=Brassica cretica TaxID=69181 RepID=A0A8S9FW42_BRACR|nr:hypothetical protein F2Q68_00021150 [Brassica cretica]
MWPIYGINSSSSFYVLHLVGSTRCYILDQTFCFFRAPGTEAPFTGCVKRDLVMNGNTPVKANGAGSSGASSCAKVGESEGRALASHQLIGKGMDQEVFKKVDLEAFFKALKEW